MASRVTRAASRRAVESRRQAPNTKTRHDGISLIQRDLRSSRHVKEVTGKPSKEDDGDDNGTEDDGLDDSSEESSREGSEEGSAQGQPQTREESLMLRINRDLWEGAAYETMAERAASSKSSRKRVSSQNRPYRTASPVARKKSRLGQAQPQLPHAEGPRARARAARRPAGAASPSLSSRREQVTGLQPTARRRPPAGRDETIHDSLRANDDENKDEAYNRGDDDDEGEEAGPDICGDGDMLTKSQKQRSSQSPATQHPPPTLSQRPRLRPIADIKKRAAEQRGKVQAPEQSGHVQKAASAGSVRQTGNASQRAKHQPHDQQSQAGTRGASDESTDPFGSDQDVDADEGIRPRQAVAPASAETQAERTRRLEEQDQRAAEERARREEARQADFRRRMALCYASTRKMRQTR